MHDLKYDLEKSKYGAKRFSVTRIARNFAIWTWPLFVLTGLTSCASAPPPLVETQIREVRVPVRTPMPEKCFKDHQPPQPFSSEGRLPVGQLDDWAEGLATTLEKEWATNAECRDLNEQRGPLSAPLVDST